MAGNTGHAYETGMMDDAGKFVVFTEYLFFVVQFGQVIIKLPKILRRCYL